MAKVMGHVFKVECWEKHPSRGSFGLLWLGEIGNGKGKGFGKVKRGYLAFYL